MTKETLKEINTRLIDYLSINHLFFESVENEGDKITFYNYSSPEYEDKKDEILKLLENFYKLLDLLVFVEVEQIGDNIGEYMQITICENIPRF